MSTIMSLPTLYKKTSTGAQQQWEISVAEDEREQIPPYGVIITRYGQTGGKIQEARDLVKEGKNLGKKNETTPYEQACAEAQSQWEKKLKKGYVQTAEGAMAGEIDTDAITGGVSPMLAQRYDEQGHKIKWPAYADPKLDGHRMVAVVVDGKCTLWTRSRKPIHSLPHIVKAIEGLGELNAIFDGEAYNHELRERFEELTSLIRAKEPRPGHEVIQYWLYDMPSMKGGFLTRKSALGAILADATTSLYCVPSLRVSDEEELFIAYTSYRDQGFEGAMVRNEGALYESKRSYHLQKVKLMLDREYEVVDVIEGRGKLAGHGIFVCAVKKGGPTFQVKMAGPIERLREFWERPEIVKGRQVTVQYQNLTANGFPRFPVAIRFRDPV